MTPDELQSLIERLPTISNAQLDELWEAMRQEAVRRLDEESEKWIAPLNEFLKQAATFSVHLKPKQLKELTRLTKHTNSVVHFRCGGELGFSNVAARSLIGIWKSIRPHWGEVEEGSFAQLLDAAHQQRLEGAAEEVVRAA